MLEARQRDMNLVPRATKGELRSQAMRELTVQSCYICRGWFTVLADFELLRNITPAWQGFWLTAHTELNRRVCQPTAWESKIQLHLAALTCSSSLVQNHLWAPAYTGDHSHFSHIPEVVGTLILRKHRAWRDTYELHLCLWTLFIFSPAVCIYFGVLRQWV